MRHKFFSISLLVIFVAMTRCTNPTGQQEAGSMESAPTQTSVATSAPEPSPATHAAFTPTSIFSTDITGPILSTITTTVSTDTAPATATSVPTVTPIPTLTIEQLANLGNLLSELMRTNAGCELPCFWGIQPGVTTAQEAEELFEKRGVAWRENSVALGYPRGDGSYYVSDVNVSFSIANDLIESMFVQGARDAYDLSFRFTEDWDQYSVARMLARFGVPTEVALSAAFFPEPSMSNDYYLSLLFPSSGIEVNYRIAAETLGNGRSRVCFGIDHVKDIFLHLNAPGYLNEQPTSEPGMEEEVETWQEATGMSVEEFYELMMDSDDEDCIVVG